MHLSERPLIETASIQARIADLAREISADYHGEPLVLLVVLKGSLHFASDLQRALPIEQSVQLEFIRARSYAGTTSSGDVRLGYTPELNLQGHHVLILEDILDTGRTATVIRDYVQARRPASVKIGALLDKPARRVVPIEADYVGFEIDDYFVVGYGLDYNEAYRHLPAIYCLT